MEMMGVSRIEMDKEMPHLLGFPRLSESELAAEWGPLLSYLLDKHTWMNHLTPYLESKVWRKRNHYTNYERTGRLVLNVMIFSVYLMAKYLGKKNILFPSPITSWF